MSQAVINQNDPFKIGTWQRTMTYWHLEAPMSFLCYEESWGCTGDWDSVLLTVSHSNELGNKM